MRARTATPHRHSSPAEPAFPRKTKNEQRNSIGDGSTGGQPCARVPALCIETPADKVSGAGMDAASFGEQWSNLTVTSSGDAVTTLLPVQGQRLIERDGDPISDRQRGDGQESKRSCKRRWGGRRSSDQDFTGDRDTQTKTKLSDGGKRGERDKKRREWRKPI
ncbi:hypothetical protein MRX96_035351 [Rhipicephalus microplus]